MAVPVFGPSVSRTILLPACVNSVNVDRETVHIGVSMVSTLKPRFLTLITIHKPLGIAILALAALRLAVRLRLAAPPFA